MRFSELVKASWHALIANPKRSFLTTIGIIIGIASVVTIMSLGAGVKKQMLRDLDTTQTGQQTAEIYYNSRDMFLNEPGFDNRDVTMLMDANLKGVAKVEILQQTKKIGLTAIINDSRQAMTADLVNKPVKQPIVAGQNLTTYDFEVKNPVMLMSDKLATKMYTTAANAVGTSVTVQQTTYTVIGVYHNKAADARLPKPLYLNSSTGKQGNGIKLTFKPGAQVSVGANQALHQLKKSGSHHRDGRYEYIDMGKLLKGISKSISGITYFVAAIAGISLFIAGIGVMNMMYISVSERTQEIGVRLALGATPKNIMMQFLLEAIILTVSGGVIGLVIGTSVAAVASMAMPFRAIVTPASVALAFGVSTAVGIVFGLLPAKQAANKNLIDILR